MASRPVLSQIPHVTVRGQLGKLLDRLEATVIVNGREYDLVLACMFVVFYIICLSSLADVWSVHENNINRVDMDLAYSAGFFMATAISRVYGGDRMSLRDIVIFLEFGLRIS